MKCIYMRQPWTFTLMHEFFSRLSIASVDGKQHLSEVVFSALVWFSLSSGIWYTQDSSPVIMVFMKSGSLWSPACPVRLQYEVVFALLQSFCHFPYNENLTKALNTTSLKWCLPSTDAIDRKNFTHVYEGSRSPHASAFHWKPPVFAKKKKTRSDAFLIG